MDNRMIVTNTAGREIGYLDYSIEMDLDLGDTNDFEFEMKMASWDKTKMDYGFLIALPGTEYGGMVGDIQTITKDAKVKLTGDTWRGMLAKKIIEPPTGQDYRKVSGELNTIIGELISGQFDDLFMAASANTGVYVQNYQFERYCTLLTGIEDMLASVGYRIKIVYKEGDSGFSGWVEVEAVPIIDYSETEEFSQDSKVNFTVQDYRRGINHLICAGTGEGAGRTVLHLYVQEDGSIGNTKYYTGLNERVALYSYTSQTDADKLREDGEKRLKEMMNYKEMEVTVEEVDLAVGDTVSGRDYVTGMVIQKPIIQKILKIDGDKESIEYKTKGDD